MLAVEVENEEEIKKILTQIAPKEAKRIIRRTMTKSAAEIRNIARSRVRTRTRTLNKAIVSKRDRGTKTSFESSVWVKHGRGVNHSAFYWRFQEWGTRAKSGQPFLTPAFVKGKQQFFRFFKTVFFRELIKEMKKRGARE